jgi:hypothetical protein
MHQLKASQRGMTFLGLLVVGTFLAVSGVIIAQIVPTAIEYQAIAKAAGKDLEVTKVGDRVVVAFAYQREIHLAGPGYLTLKYAGRSSSN